MSNRDLFVHQMMSISEEWTKSFLSCLILVVFTGFKVQPNWIGTALCLAMVDHGCICKYRRLDCRHTCEPRSFDNSSS